MRQVSAWVVISLVCWLLLVVSAVKAGELHRGVRAKYEENCREILEENFRAFNAEDLQAFMRTIHPAAARPRDHARLAREATDLWQHADVSIQVVAVTFEVVTKNMAAASVVQETHTLDAESSQYRNRSALVPKERLVRYRQIFTRDRNGRWLLGPIATEPSPVNNLELIQDGR